MAERLRKLNDLLRDEIAKILLTELEKDEGILVTATGADVSPTLEHATIKISVFPAEKAGEILKKIKTQIYTIQQKLNKRLKMHPVPKIRFVIDKNEEQAGKIDELFKNL